jgi:hypothetical protein
MKNLSNRGLPIEELVAKDDEYSNGLNKLCDDLYAGIDTQVKGAERQALIERGKAKLALFKELTAELTGAQLASFVKTYRTMTDEITKFVKALEANN